MLYVIGAFYMWQDLDKAPIIPVVVYGAFELHPPGMFICICLFVIIYVSVCMDINVIVIIGSSFNKCGKVYCRFLSPLTVTDLPTDTTNARESMLRLLRRTMLVDIINNSPLDIASDISWNQRLRSLTIVLVMHTWNIIVCRYMFIHYIAIPSVIYNTSDLKAVLSMYIYNTSVIGGKVLGIIILITLFLFVYISFIQPLMFTLYKKIFGTTKSTNTVDKKRT